jgi:hypothetical protein
MSGPSQLVPLSNPEPNETYNDTYNDRQAPSTPGTAAALVAAVSDVLFLTGKSILLCALTLHMYPCPTLLRQLWLQLQKSMRKAHPAERPTVGMARQPRRTMMVCAIHLGLSM